MTELDFKSMASEVRAAVARETGPRALRSLSTHVRRLLVGIWCIIALGLTLLLVPRPDLHSLRSLIAFTMLASCLLPAFVMVWLSIGYSHAIPPSKRRIAALALYAALVPLALALCLAQPSAPDLSAIKGAGKCFGLGLAGATLVNLSMWLTDRRLGWRRSLMGACGASLLAETMLAIHCPNSHIIHLLAGHAPLAVVWIALWWIARR